MPFYCVNTNAQPNGDHEVHDTGACTTLPHPANRKDLGFHADCRSAVRLAKVAYPRANGCFWCSRACHTS